MPTEALAMLSEALWLALLLAGPAAAAAWLTGITLSLLADRIGARDPTLSAFPRIAAALGAIAVASPWILEQTLAFGRVAFGAALGLSVE